MSGLIDETGNVYGRLTVLRQAIKDEMNEAQKRNPGACWICQCECGSVAVVRGGSLRCGHTKSCGCFRREQGLERARLLEAWVEKHGGPRLLPRGEAAMNGVLYDYKYRAAENDFMWALTREEFVELTSSECHYCGAPPEQVRSHPGGNGGYTYNGIDRVDNNRGYVIDNVVPCCKRCNVAKGDMRMNEFKEWVVQVHRHLNLADAIREMGR